MFWLQGIAGRTGGAGHTQRFRPELEAPGCRQARMFRRLPAGSAAGAGARPHHLTAWRDTCGRAAESLLLFECIS